ncbi:MAG: gephyrin-like molybdotransferase Glp [bacterium]
MISVQEAQNRILAQVTAMPALRVGLREALGRFAAEPVAALQDSPAFANSAMDGYALRAAQTLGASPGSPLRMAVAATAAAGTPLKKPLLPGEAARIYTGAVLPEGLDAVVKQEDVVAERGYLELSRPVKEGENVRARGEEFRAGEEILARGACLTPATLALLAGQGIHEVSVFRPPRVGILVTGTEIVAPGMPLEPGQIYDSNSFALAAALRELYLEPVSVSRCRDQREELAWRIATDLEGCDFLLVTGGVSVGDFDFVRETAANLGIRESFWKVRQKPGKPIFFGRQGEKKYFFGLPGNPASALVCFYEYVRPALLRALGAAEGRLPRLSLPLAAAFRKKPGLAHFLRARAELAGTGGQVRILEQQGSHTLQSFGQANALVLVPEEVEVLPAGAPVEVHLLPALLGEGGGPRP